MGQFSKCEHGIIRETGSCLQCPFHCNETVKCSDNVYCNCFCEHCSGTDCFRPNCLCNKSHLMRNSINKAMKDKI